MQKIEKTFDINGVLLKVYSSLESIIEKRRIELIYDMSATIPKDLRGDVDVFTRLLTKVLTFVFQNTDTREIVLSLSAPEDFLYEEFISFRINDTHIAKEEILDYLEKNINGELEILDGKIVYDKDSDIYLNIPFHNNELGYRRHYRLPDTGMLGKKVLIISDSEKVTQSIKKMFTYFLYKVDIGFEEFEAQGNDLSKYDILVIDDSFVTDEFEHTVAKVQKEIPLKYVSLRDAHIIEDKYAGVVSTHLIKPVTQESIFSLIAELYSHDLQAEENRSEMKKCIVDLEKILHKNRKYDNLRKEKHVAYNFTNENLNHIIETKKQVKALILDTKLGEENAKKVGLKYTKELKNFLEIFDRSDIYFREIVNEISTNKIKEFCIHLERKSKIIGAESMLGFTNIISLIFIHDKLDILPIYPGRYHIELQNLLEAIREYLGTK